MGMTMSQKIIAAHCGKKSVKVGEFVEARLDVVLGNDITSPVAINEFHRMGAEKVFDKHKVILVPDHFTPNKDIKSAEQSKKVREFAREQEISNYFEVGRVGIEHALLPEQGLVVPGDMIIGADSHTCTYGALGAFSTGIGSTDMASGMAIGTTWFRVPSAIRIELTGKPGRWVSGKDVILHIIGLIGVDGARYQSMEVTGDGIKHLTMDDRFTIANMVIEAGAKNGIFPVDSITMDYVKAHKTKNRGMKKKIVKYAADPDAKYDFAMKINLSELKPTVAMPNLPDNTKQVWEVAGIKIDQVVIGSCTNGRISDMEIAAKIMKGKKIADGVRTIVIPATQEIYLECVKRGFAEIFVNAGAVFSTPTCGPCLGGHMGILASGEKCVSTTNRNFTGRMGHETSEIYLASPAVAAASAISGYLTEPGKKKLIL